MMPLMELCSRMHVCPPQMIPGLCLVVLSSLIASSQSGLEEVFFSPWDQTVIEGDEASFHCVSGESSTPASILWIKDGRLVTTGRQSQGEYGGGHQKKTSGRLLLVNVSLEDAGTYVCQTVNPSLNISRKSRPAKLTVLDHDVLDDLKQFNSLSDSNNSSKDSQFTTLQTQQITGQLHHNKNIKLIVTV
ncbi:tyrosine-protein kinase-like otk [Syngnathoides biaculeatus]|uniref:tyrosine-protein kinase-like otk n=1 Tax=Syngnathoides biaculeatus TaxID=300417 RepID=UPI002ADE404F|nr:tyrosine-protein kinase-like otk [Syngnathoides biaculeatus]